MKNRIVTAKEIIESFKFYNKFRNTYYPNDNFIANSVGKGKIIKTKIINKKGLEIKKINIPLNPKMLRTIKSKSGKTSENKWMR